MTRLMYMTVKFSVFTLLIMAFSVLPAVAQSNAEMENRLRRLENELQTLGRAVFRGDIQQAPSSFQVEGGAAQQQQMQVANMGVRITQIESQMRQLTGQIEQQNFQIRQLQNQLQVMSQQPTAQISQQTQDSQGFTRMQQPQTAANISSSTQISPVQGNVTSDQLGQIVQGQDGQAVVNTQNPAYLYDNAFAMLQNGDYAGSANAFTSFLQNYATHPLAANAQYWLGETFYVRNSYQEAAKSFAQGYQKYPTSPKAPDSLLKLSLSLSNLGQKEEACVTLMQLNEQYPRASNAIKDKAEEETQKLSCK